MKLPGVISLRKDLPIWPIPKGYLAASGALHVLKVYEYALRGFGTEIYLAGGVLVNALECFEHHVELADAV